MRALPVSLCRMAQTFLSESSSSPHDIHNASPLLYKTCFLQAVHHSPIHLSMSPHSLTDGGSVASRSSQGSSIASSITSAGKTLLAVAKRIGKKTAKGALLIAEQAKKVKAKGSSKRLKTTSGAAIAAPVIDPSMTLISIVSPWVSSFSVLYLPITDSSFHVQSFIHK